MPFPSRVALFEPRATQLVTRFVDESSSPPSASWFDQRPDFDRADARGRDTRGDAYGLVEILGLDQVVAAELLARFREWTVGDKPFAAADLDRSRGRGRMQLRAAHVLTAVLDAFGQLSVILEDLLLFGLAHLSPGFFIVVNQQHVFHVCLRQ